MEGMGMEATNREQLVRWLVDIRQNKLNARELYHAIHELGRAEFLEARPEVERLLSSEDPELRYVALEVVTRHWRLAEHWNTAKRFLELDADTDCRMIGASALETLKRNTQDRRTLEVLARVVRNNQEKQIVREAAYAAMLGILGANPREHVRMASRGIDLERDVKWEMVDSYLQE
jgi:hypothetical protein